MYDKIICMSVGGRHPLTNRELLVLLLAAHHLVVTRKREISAVIKEDRLIVRVQVGKEYTNFLGIRSRQYVATVLRDLTTVVTVRYLVDEQYLRTTPLPDVSTEYERVHNPSTLKIIMPESPTYN